MGPRTSPARHRPRRGSLERPINGRLYRTAWLVVALPLLLTAFTVGRPAPLPAPRLPPTFDRSAAVETATAFSERFPDRSPGSPSAVGAADWLAERLEPLGFLPKVDTFRATIPGRGTVTLRNIHVVALPKTSSQESPVIVVMAHRDNTGIGPGASDNASGTAALLELARMYSRPTAPSGRAVRPAHTIVFLSTDGGAFGGLGAARFAKDSPYRSRVAAVLNLDTLASTGHPRLEIAGDRARSPADVLVETAAARIEEEVGTPPGRSSFFGQLIDLGFPFSLYEQAPFVGLGIPAVTLTSAGNRPIASVPDAPERLNGARLGQLGRAAQSLLGSLDEGVALSQGSSYVYLGTRYVRGWALALSLFAMLIPFGIAAVNLFARCRRRRIPLAPALRSYRSRLLFWLWAGALFLSFALVGAWPGGAARPPNPESSGGTDWPTLALLGFLALLTLSWFVARQRLRPWRAITAEEELAGHTGVLLALGVIALVVVATNPFALIFILPSLHAWLWLPHLRERPPWVRAAVLAAGFLGPLLLLGSFAFRFGLGLDAPWYLAELAAIGYVPIVGIATALAWLAAGAQVTALALGRYAPYPHASERPPGGPFRNTVRALVLARREWRRSRAEQQILEG